MEGVEPEHRKHHLGDSKEVPDLTHANLAVVIERQTWRFAKTMPQWPHWYWLRRDAANSAEFAALARHILAFGYLAEFRPERRADWAIRRYLDIDAFHYWIMCDDPADATLINRARTPITFKGTGGLLTHGRPLSLGPAVLQPP